MRFAFDDNKSRVVKQKHGISLKEAEAIFDQVHVIDRKRDVPEQFRAIGWSKGRLCSVIFEIRQDEEGDYYHLITAWRASKHEERAFFENT